MGGEYTKVSKKTHGKIKNVQSSETGNIEYRRHKTKTTKPKTQIFIIAYSIDLKKKHRKIKR